MIVTTMPAYRMLGQAPFTITGSVKNLGTDTITSFDINYRINGGQIISGTINTVNIIPASNFTFSHPFPWVPADTGTYNVNIWASNLNGGNDEDTTNDHLLFNVAVLDTFVVRNTCIELFTGTWCAPCHYTNLAFNNNVLPNISHYTFIAYHMGPDVFATWEGHNRAGYYSDSTVPQYYFDGINDSPALTVFNSYQEKPAFISINIYDAHYTDSTVYVSGYVMPLVDYFTGSCNLQVAIIEKANSLHPYGLDTFYYYIQIKMSPNEFGTQMGSLTAGNPFWFSQIIPIQISHVQSMSDLKVVVFVQNDNNKEIQQSAWRDITFSNGLIKIPNKDFNLTIFPNPVFDRVFIKADISHPRHCYTISLTDMMGRKLATLKADLSFTVPQYFDVSELVSGIYFITLKSGEEYLVKKFVKD